MTSEAPATEGPFAKVVATWAAFVAALFLALPRPLSVAAYLLGCAVGLGLCVLGFLATDQVRGHIPSRDAGTTAKLALLSLSLGAGLGTVLLGILWSLARAEPALSARFAGRLGEPPWRPWALAFESSILEEVVFRLVVLGCIAWMVVRFSSRAAHLHFAIALVVSTVLFGLAHVPAWAAATSPGWLLVLVVLALNGVGALALGWLFWRWGLGYAILCHFAGDVVIQAIGPKILA